MGSSQSTPTQSNVPTTEKSFPDLSASDDSMTSSQDTKTTISYHKTKSDSAEGLSGMNLVHHVCRKRKKIYDKCVSNFYARDFLGGKSLNQEEACGDKFEAYRKCILKGIRKEVWEKQYNLPPPAENSPLADVDED